ncbi:MerR family transcriptional regulator [Gordonibacter sp. An232A]|nr:MerR family transcriptional regulator [Gordonibacter sp. An232A]
MYRMKEFSAMTGLPQSKVRFYEKHGLVLSDRQENGYRVFTPEDAFRSNAFRTLLQYGFSIDEAVAMLDAKQGTEEFERSLLHQQEKLRREADLIAYRLRRLDSTLGAIKSEPGSGFELVDASDQVYINSSHGRDFRVSLENEKTISQYYDLLSITSCARIIKKDDLLDNRPVVDPDYVMTMPEYESYRLDEQAQTQVKRLCLGKCIRFRRQATREESVRKETFADLFEYLESHGYRLRSDLMLFPSFLNLDGLGSDIETLYVPIS